MIFEQKFKLFANTWGIPQKVLTTNGKKEPQYRAIHTPHHLNPPQPRYVTLQYIWPGQPTPVFLPGESHGLADYNPRGREELDTAEHTRTQCVWGEVEDPV